jgi:hypothetical protein
MSRDPGQWSQLPASMLVSDLLDDLQKERFASAEPYPWLALSGCLHQEAFDALRCNFPQRQLFARHQGIAPAGILRAHDRWHLAYDPTGTLQIRAGCARSTDLPPAWQAFIAALTGREYQSWVRRLFGVRHLKTRFAWHLAGAGDEVSPHLDAPKKLGTHLFYFNTTADWNPDWGGATLLLGRPRHGVSQPDFADFASVVSAPFLDNHSLLFMNGPNAWHGVETLRPPPGHLRRLFTVVFEYPRPLHWLRSAVTKLRPAAAP